jgi:hypothetical protein
MSNYVLTPAAVRKLRGILSHPSGNTGATLRPASISLDEFPPPFAVRWSASETSGGTWLIWLPDRAKLVSYDGSYISTIIGVTAAQNFPAGYYTVTALSASSTSVYLNVTVTDSTGAATAELSDTAGTASSGETVYSVLIATMATDANTGAKLVKQFVASAIVLGGGGGETVTPDDISTEFIPPPAEGQSPTGNEGKLQIKGWDKGLPRYYSIAQLINGSSSTDLRWNRVPIRLYQAAGDTPAGGLVYADIGTLEQLLGSTVAKSSQKILTGLSWDATNHKLVISSATVNIANGVITTWTDNVAEDIPTTSIDSIIN